ncbi:MAG: rhomboid family intramembrane serine protease [Spirochaetaceae bacterium]|jgi:membrane associated rhomboid family serine protease|nr:rhomboid family intramembrane serine protease [Spirochaetaceae bacterium]
MSFLRRPFRYRYENITLFLIGITILVFLAQQLFARQYLSEYLAMIPLAVVINGWVWQFVTYMFAHGGLTHLLFNMLALFIFGSQVERRIGSREFLLYYLLTGILAGVFSFGVYWFTGAYRIHLVGASGAIFAVQLAYATFFPDAVIFIWGILPMRAPIMVLAFTLLELFSSFFDHRSGIAHFTHLAGFGFGWIYFLVRFGINPWKALTSR